MIELQITDGVLLIRVPQPRTGVLADGLEQPVPSGLGDNKRFVDKPPEDLQYAVPSAQRPALRPK